MTESSGGEVCFFFFSSRRRHTRYWRDWSSDVCSSDLVGAFLAGDAPNVIPDTAELRGTVRSFTPENRRLLAERIEALVRGIATAMRAEVDVRYRFGYPPTVNDPEMTELVRAAAAEVVGPENLIDGPLHMGAED